MCGVFWEPILRDVRAPELGYKVPLPIGRYLTRPLSLLLSGCLLDNSLHFQCVRLIVTFGISLQTHSLNT